MSILITGANGYIGRKLADMLLGERKEENLLLWVHARNREEFEKKKLGLPQTPSVSFSWGDLKAKEPFSEIDPGMISKIIHTAAVTRFNVEEDLAQQVNLEGTQKALVFASACPKLEKFSMISTVYTSGLKSGIIEERLAEERPKFANFYEHSKYESELLVASSTLPWNILRAATIITDDDSGQVTQYNAFHNTLKLLFYGLVSLLPGTPETPIYLVKGDFIAGAICSLLDRKGIYHLCDQHSNAITLGRLIDIAFEEFQNDPDFRARRILKPLYSDKESFDILADGLDGFAGDIVNQSIRSIAPFASQLFVKKYFINDRMRADCPWYEPPNIEDLVRRTCAHLIKTRWGRT